MRLVAGGRSGRAIVRAFSGGITSGDLAVDIGGAAAGSHRPERQPVQRAVDRRHQHDPRGGLRRRRQPPAGRVGLVHDHRRRHLVAVVVTNGLGEATTTITTNRDATVTASAGGSSGGGGRSGEGGGGGAGTPAVTATVTITASPAPTMTITPPTAPPIVDTPATFTVAAAATAPATVRTITVDFGDGTSPQTFGNTTSVAHTYRSSGTFTVTATVEDTDGSRNTGSTVVVVQSSSFLVILAATPSTVGPPIVDLHRHRHAEPGQHRRAVGDVHLRRRQRA